jgi:hypothetical protein
MSDPMLAFFCEVCGAGISVDDASETEWQRATHGEPRCDDWEGGMDMSDFRIGDAVAFAVKPGPLYTAQVFYGRVAHHNEHGLTLTLIDTVMDQEDDITVFVSWDMLAVAQCAPTIEVLPAYQDSWRHRAMLWAALRGGPGGEASGAGGR